MTDDEQTDRPGPGAGHVPLPEIRELLFADLGPAEALRRFGGGDAGDGAVAPPAALLHHLARAAADGRRDDAAAIVARTEAEPGTESRVRLQAWTLARAAGVPVPPELVARVLGVVVDVGLPTGTDTVAGFADGSARYLNQGGGGVIWEANADTDIAGRIAALVAAGQSVAERIGPLDGPRPPAPGNGDVTIWLLAPDGIYMGAGSFGALAADPMGGPIIGTAGNLMAGLIDRAGAQRGGQQQG